MAQIICSIRGWMLWPRQSVILRGTRRCQAISVGLSKCCLYSISNFWRNLSICSIWPLQAKSVFDRCYHRGINHTGDAV